MINLSDLPSTPFSELTNLPNKFGIYFALDSSNDVLYIGLAKNINKRWVEHHRIVDLKELNCDRVAWFLCPESEIEIIERDALLKFRPLLNGVAMRRNSVPKEIQRSTNLDVELNSIFSQFYADNHRRYKKDLNWSDLKGNV